MQLPEDISGLDDLIGRRLDSVEFDADESELLLVLEGKLLRIFIDVDDDGELIIGMETNREGMH